MCYVIITGGPNVSLAPLHDYLINAQKIIAADSGADRLLEIAFLPHEVVGDFDSAADATKAWIQDEKIPIRQFPVEKDMTDTELALSDVPFSESILLVCSLTGRIDHVMSNLMIAAKLARDGRQIEVTDGDTWIYPRSGNGSWRFVDSPFWHDDGREPVFSIIPVFGDATGVTTIGMKYSLHHHTLTIGSSFPISNALGDGNAHGFDYESGTMLFIVSKCI